MGVVVAVGNSVIVANIIMVIEQLYVVIEL
jgi:hypothetical protein